MLRDSCPLTSHEASFRVSHDPKPRVDTLWPRSWPHFRLTRPSNPFTINTTRCFLSLSEETFSKFTPHNHNKNMRLTVKINYQQISWNWTPSQNKLWPRPMVGSLLSPPPLLRAPFMEATLRVNKEGKGWASGTYFHSNFKFKLLSNFPGPSEWPCTKAGDYRDPETKREGKGKKKGRKKRKKIHIYIYLNCNSDLPGQSILPQFSREYYSKNRIRVNTQ